MSHGIESQYHKTLQSQISGQPLSFRFPLLCVAGLQQHPGITTGLVRPVNIRSDKKARQAFENHFLDRVVPSLDTAGNSWIQRTVVVGQTADKRQKCFADELFPAFRVGDAANFADGIFPLLQLPLSDLIHPPEKWVRSGLLSRER